LEATISGHLDRSASYLKMESGQIHQASYARAEQEALRGHHSYNNSFKGSQNKNTNGRNKIRVKTKD